MTSTLNFKIELYRRINIYAFRRFITEAKNFFLTIERVQFDTEDGRVNII